MGSLGETTQKAEGMGQSLAKLAMLIAFLFLCSACQRSIGSTPQVGLPDRIAFSSLRDGNWEIYVMNPDGSNQTRLTYDPGIDERPAWAPDGRTIVFQSLRNGNFDLYLLNVSQVSEKRLTYTAEDEKSARWSPQGDKLIYASWRRALSLGVEVLEIGTGRRSILLSPGSFGASWSPDGRYIAYYLSPEIVPNSEIYRRNSDGTGEVRLTKTGPLEHNINPRWSPNGKKIAFQSRRDGNWEIYVMNSDGTEETRLTYNRYDDEYPSWSPDGEWIAFESNAGSSRQIYVMRADGSQQTQLTNERRGNRHPAWSPQ